MISLLDDVLVEHLDKYSYFHLHHLMVPDTKYHAEMIDQYFCYNVDNRQELEMDHNNHEAVFFIPGTAQIV